MYTEQWLDEFFALFKLKYTVKIDLLNIRIIFRCKKKGLVQSGIYVDYLARYCYKSKKLIAPKSLFEQALFRTVLKPSVLTFSNNVFNFVFVCAISFCVHFLE